MLFPPGKRFIIFSVAIAAVFAIILLIIDFTLWNPSSNKQSPLYGMKFSRVIYLPKSVTDLSGITYDPIDNTLYAISNKPPEIFQVSLDGTLLRRIKLHGFQDTEGVEYIEPGKFVVIDERRHEIIEIKITHETTDIYYNDGKKKQLDVATLGQPAVKNRGFEGIAVGPQGKLIVANEQHPVLIGAIEKTETGAENFSLHDTFTPPGKDVAGLHYWIAENKLLALSEASRKITVFNDAGKIEGTYKLTHDRLGLWPRIKQPEGITVDAENRIYIAAEPNMIYVLQ